MKKEFKWINCNNIQNNIIDKFKTEYKSNRTRINCVDHVINSEYILLFIYIVLKVSLNYN